MHILLSTEAEFVAVCKSTQEIMAFNQVVKPMDIKPNTHILNDDDALSSRLTHYSVHHFQTEHKEVQYYLV